MSSGSAIFASVNSPPRHVNPDRVYSADWRDVLLDLNRGYLARLSQKFTNAPCKCRNVCCNGTDDTSDRNANSGSCFHSVSAADDCT